MRSLIMVIPLFDLICLSFDSLVLSKVCLSHDKKCYFILCVHQRSLGCSSALRGPSKKIPRPDCINICLPPGKEWAQAFLFQL